MMLLHIINPARRDFNIKRKWFWFCLKKCENKALRVITQYGSSSFPAKEAPYFISGKRFVLCWKHPRV
jgi:hypothetical protein